MYNESDPGAEPQSALPSGGIYLVLPCVFVLPILLTKYGSVLFSSSKRRQHVRENRWKPGEDPTVATQEMRDHFEPELRSKEWIERMLITKIFITVFVLSHIGLIGMCLASSGSAAALLCKIGAVCAAIFWSDLFTGLVHIYFDHRRCDIGDGQDMIAYSFRYDHHASPGNFNQFSAFFPSGFGEIVARGTLPISLVMHASFWLINWYDVDSAAEALYLGNVAWILTGACCQSTHSLAHAPPKIVPRPIKFLQWTGLILNRQTHLLHHQGAHNKNFCIFNGWANPLLNACVPTIFDIMRSMPNHFDQAAVNPSWHTDKAAAKKKAASLKAE